jgi:hypothetical protein
MDSRRTLASGAGTVKNHLGTLSAVMHSSKTGAEHLK